MPLSAWTQIFGGEEVVGRWQPGLGSGQFLPSGTGEGGLHFPLFPGQAGGSQAAGAGAVGWGPFAQLAAPHTLSSGLSFSTPHRPPVDDHYS